jgi:hypothetical protein
MEVKTTIKNLERVCAVVDLQGFSFKAPREVNGIDYDYFPSKNGEKLFYIPRELAIVSPSMKLHFTYGGQLFNSIHGLQDVQMQLKFQTVYIHGLPYAPLYPYDREENNLISDLQVVHKLLAKNSKPFFAIKNQYLKLYLEKANIPFVNLERTDGFLDVPTVWDLDNKFGYFCCRHHQYHRAPLAKNYNEKIRCAKRKAMHFNRWIRERIGMC